MGAALPDDLGERARLSMALWDAMRSNDGDRTIQLLEECDTKMLGKGDRMPLYRTAGHFVEIDKMLSARALNLMALKQRYAQTLAECPDVPNRGLLCDRIHFVESRRRFAEMTDRAVRTMLISEIEDAMIYANRHRITRCTLYHKLKRLFEHEQIRRFIVSEQALSRQLNFDQILFEEDELKRIRFENGKTNFNHFTSPFNFEGGTMDGDPVDEVLSISFDDDIAEFLDLASAQMVPAVAVLPPTQQKAEAMPLDIPLLSDEENSDFSSELHLDRNLKEEVETQIDAMLRANENHFEALKRKDRGDDSSSSSELAKGSLSILECLCCCFQRKTHFEAKHADDELQDVAMGVADPGLLEDDGLRMSALNRLEHSDSDRSDHGGSDGKGSDDVMVPELNGVETPEIEKEIEINDIANRPL